MSHHLAESVVPGAAGDRRERAALAARSVETLFGERVFGMPGTWLGAVAFPHPSRRSTTWHYWWQAHLMDALIDAAYRESATGQDPGPTRKLAHQLLRGITVRNGGQVTLNNYYDDMAWLMLAVGRLRDLDESAGRVPRGVAATGAQLLRSLRAAHTQDLDGGVFWTRERTYKNTATTGPAALIAARTHAREESAALLNWLRGNLWNSQRQVFHDGLKIVPAGDGEPGTTLDSSVYTYNSGPALGAAVELAESSDGGEAREWAGFAAEIVEGADAEFGRAVDGRRVLRTHGAGDAGLFTGILARYLALAARSEALDSETRQAARRLVVDTADALWEGRREFDPDLDFNDPEAQPEPARVLAIFSPDPLVHADISQPVGRSLELGHQIQAWTALEAAAGLSPRV
ncbi:glycosidase [Kocuria coralli]|uniref:Glycosidase n=1 Tax=Kocuria coralli TaxID=1461025 RepID=A0A5J5L0F2_9MICC|nr:glycoside hydrolase family 76 protein [Kocuria coralli]KAA9395424.1 glycosidase [Kocuria coralli]